MVQFFQEGGFTMWIVLLLGSASTSLAVAAVILALGKRRTAILMVGVASLVGGLLTAAAGVGAYFWAISRVMAAVAVVDPSLKARILAQGISEAANNILLGTLLAPLPFLVGVVALVRGFALPSEPGAPQ
jgi:hypothetical protein